MKVTVSKYLNVRVGAPDINADCYQYLAPGSTIEVEDRLYDGKDFRGNSKWYKDKYNNFYWSGGVKLNDKPVFSCSKLDADIDSASLQWWHKNYEIDKIWENWSLGYGAKVAVLDTGYYREHELSRKDVDGWSFVDENGSNFRDYNGHGTSVTSVINNTHKKLYGVAPEASIFSYKIQKKYKDLEAFIRALERCAESDADIISISYGFDKLDEASKKRLYESIKLNSNKLVVCAVGNLENKNKLDKQYPAMFLNTIGVGSVNEKGELAKKSSKSTAVSLVAPGESLNLININSSQLKPFQGTSYAVPFVAGVAALMISYARRIKPNIPIAKWNIGEIIMDTADFEPSMDKQLFGSGIINPINAFQKLEKILKK